MIEPISLGAIYSGQIYICLNNALLSWVRMAPSASSRRAVKVFCCWFFYIFLFAFNFFGFNRIYSSVKLLISGISSYLGRLCQKKMDSLPGIFRCLLERLAVDSGVFLMLVNLF